MSLRYSTGNLNYCGSYASPTECGLGFHMRAEDWSREGNNQ